MKKKLCKSRYDRKLSGVCGGIAEYFEIDSTIVRIIFLAMLFTSISFWLYLGCMLIMPEDNSDRQYYDKQNNS